MDFIQSKDSQEGVQDLVADISTSLQSGKKVAWLLSGGSNVYISVKVMEELRLKVTKEELIRLSILLVDERFGPVGHPDSNWQQLLNAGFNIEGTNALPVLRNIPFERTVETYMRNMETVLSYGSRSVAQFGIGADGHLAGILPYSPAVRDNNVVCAYKEPSFMRMTITIKAIREICSAYTFAFGVSKKTAIKTLRTTSKPLDEQPAQILKSLFESHLYSDQLD